MSRAPFDNYINGDEEKPIKKCVSKSFSKVTRLQLGPVRSALIVPNCFFSNSIIKIILMNRFLSLTTRNTTSVSSTGLNRRRLGKITAETLLG